MKVEILADHPSGLKKGQVKEVAVVIGKKLIADGVAKESKKAPAKKTVKKDK